MNKLKKLLTHAHYHRLMYSGGAGGEWLISKILETSDYYNSYGNGVTSAFNRTTVHVPDIFSEATLRLSEKAEIVDIYNHLLVVFSSSKVVSSKIDETLTLLDNSHRPYLFKKHICFNPIWDNPRSYLVYTNNLETFIEWSHLVTIKCALSEKISIKIIKNLMLGMLAKQSHFLTDEQKEKRINFLNSCDDNIDAVINNGIGAFLSYPLFDAIDNDVLLGDISSLELINLYKKHYNRTDDVEFFEYLRKKIATTKEMVLLDFDRFHEEGYLQNKMSLNRDISSDFNYWRIHNTELLHQYGFK